MIGIMGSFHAQMMEWIQYLTVMNTKRLNNPQILGAPLARQCQAFPKSSWWKHFPRPWIWDSDNCELQHWPWGSINVSHHSSCHASPGSSSSCLPRSLLKPHCNFFRGKWAKHRLNTQSVSFWHYPAFWYKWLHIPGEEKPEGWSLLCPQTQY